MTNDEQFMKRALELASTAAKSGNEPFGAILVKDGKIVFETQNSIHKSSDPTAHAEMSLIREFCHTNQISDLSDYTLYTSCEPCCMCSGAMVWSKLGKLVYSASHSQLQEIAGFNIMISSEEVFEKSPFRPTTHGLILNNEGTKILADYF